ncbi:MAG: nuclear transport factor 2 family protein [Croceibacterium sp.]
MTLRFMAWAVLLHIALGAGAATAAPPDRALAAADQRLAQINRRARLQQDERDIENLQRIYGYYLDRAEWDQVADLFASDGTIEFAQRGVYVGKSHVRRFLDLLGPKGPRDGHIDDHLQLQIVVHVATDGKTAMVRARELGMGGDLGGQNHLTEGTYENTLVKNNGVWMFKSIHYYPNLSTDYDKGFGKDAQPIEIASTVYPPDRPPTEIYKAYPKAHMAPFHYPNPVTGKPVQYSGDYN